jgi:hypothetical protein
MIYDNKKSIPFKWDDFSYYLKKKLEFHRIAELVNAPVLMPVFLPGR